MRASLHLHPDSTSGAVDQITVEAARTRDRKLNLRFATTGALKRLVLPPARSGRPERADSLWQRTCFEAFVAEANADT